jgi:hypothetical protein
MILSITIAAIITLTCISGLMLLLKGMAAVIDISYINVRRKRHDKCINSN